MRTFCERTKFPTRKLEFLMKYLMTLSWCKWLPGYRTVTKNKHECHGFYINGIQYILSKMNQFRSFETHFCDEPSLKSRLFEFFFFWEKGKQSNRLKKFHQFTNELRLSPITYFNYISSNSSSSQFTHPRTQAMAFPAVAIYITNTTNR